MKKFVIENVLYISIALALVAQVVIGGDYLLGQGLFLVANAINITRTFLMKRPLADKVKDSCFFGVTLGLIILRLV